VLGAVGALVGVTTGVSVGVKGATMTVVDVAEEASEWLEHPVSNSDSRVIAATTITRSWEEFRRCNASVESPSLALLLADLEPKAKWRLSVDPSMLVTALSVVGAGPFRLR